MLLPTVAHQLNSILQYISLLVKWSKISLFSIDIFQCLCSIYAYNDKHVLQSLEGAMGSVEPMSRTGVALDLILKTLIASQDFNNIQSKNWEAISKLVPGTTSGMVWNWILLLLKCKNLMHMMVLGEVYVQCNIFEPFVSYRSISQ